jgi:hypothetical protein
MQMNKFIIALQAILFASAFGKDVCKLTEDDSRQITEIIRYEDTPLRIAEICGSSCDFTPNLQISFHAMLQLRKMIKYDRAESFKFLFPLVKFPTNYGKVTLLRDAMKNECFEICDFLMWQYLNVENTFEIIWSGPWRSNLNMLTKLAKGHQNRILEMVPPAYRIGIMDDADTVLNAIYFITFCSRLNRKFAAIRDYQPSELLHWVTRNESLRDTDLITIFSLLLRVGAKVDQEVITEFKRFHPGFIESYYVLSSAIPK